METQKTSYIPTVNGVPVKDWDSTVSFITDPIEFAYSIPWSVQWHDNGTGSWTPGEAVYSIIVSNTTNYNDAQYLKVNGTAITNFDFSGENRIIQDQFIGLRYMFVVFSPAGNTSGNVTLQLSK